MKKFVIGLLPVILLFCILIFPAAVTDEPPTPAAPEHPEGSKDWWFTEDGKLSEAFLNAYATYASYELSHQQKQMWTVPDEIMKGPTDELLDYFLSGGYVHQRLVGGIFLSSPETVRSHEERYALSRHPAFQELLTRKDLSEVLEQRVKPYADKWDNIGELAADLEEYESCEALKLFVEEAKEVCA